MTCLSRDSNPRQSFTETQDILKDALSTELPRRNQPIKQPSYVFFPVKDAFHKESRFEHRHLERRDEDAADAGDADDAKLPRLGLGAFETDAAEFRKQREQSRGSH